MEAFNALHRDFSTYRSRNIPHRSLMWQPHKTHRVGKMQFQTFKQVLRKVTTGLKV
jgi:hypothetical protein